MVGVRAALLGLFFVAADCAPRGPAALAADADRRYGTGAFTWLAAHDPSALVVSGAPVDDVRPIVPDARVSAARTPHPCREAAAARAALFVLVRDDPRGARRDAALDCGIALYRDAAALVIAPR